MTRKEISILIEKAVSDVAIKVKDIQRSFVWEEFGEYILWRELSSCILGSRIQFELARSATRHLDRAGLLRQLQNDHRYGVLRAIITKELRRPIYLPLRLDQTKRTYTFSSVRAKQLSVTAKTIYGNGRTLKTLLKQCDNEYSARELLIESASGIGPKQASLFLRNIGYANNLAILDTHVLRFMEYAHITKTFPRSIANLRSYEKTESKLFQYASDLNLKMSYLDTAIWIVMRVYKKEFAI